MEDRVSEPPESIHVIRLRQQSVYRNVLTAKILISLHYDIQERVEDLKSHRPRPELRAAQEIAQLGGRFIINGHVSE